MNLIGLSNAKFGLNGFLVIFKHYFYQPPNVFISVLKICTLTFRRFTNKEVFIMS